MKKSIRERQNAALKALKEQGIDFDDVADAICNNMEFTEDGWYKGVKHKKLLVHSNGKRVTLNHGGSVTCIGNPYKNESSESGCCGKNSFWGGFWGAVVALFFFGSG